MRRLGWRPDWTLPPEPIGDDEAAVEALFYRELGASAIASGLSWPELQEWQRESWRREYRATLPDDLHEAHLLAIRENIGFAEALRRQRRGEA